MRGHCLCVGKIVQHLQVIGLSLQGYVCLDGTSWTGSGMRPSLQFPLAPRESPSLEEITIPTFSGIQLRSGISVQFLPGGGVLVFVLVGMGGCCHQNRLNLNLTLKLLEC